MVWSMNRFLPTAVQVLAVLDGKSSPLLENACFFGYHFSLQILSEILHISIE